MAWSPTTRSRPSQWFGMVATTGTVTGSASYKGDAVGVYVHNVLTPGGGMVESRTAGHFTAAGHA